MKIRVLILWSAGLLLCQSGLAQGFVNLDFESANIPMPRISNEIEATNAFPGWNATAPLLYYDDVSISGASLSIWDTNPPASLPPIQGRYFVMLASANMPEFGITISIGQTGRIPFYAKSILFWGDIGGMQITFNDHPLAFTAQSSTVNYTIYGADVSAYAGQTGQLLFTLPPFVGTANLDNIQFSISPVPEPGKIALASIGILFFGFRRWQRTSPN